MRHFDKKLKKYAKNNKPEIPDSVAKAIQNTLDSLPEKTTNEQVCTNTRNNYIRPILAFASFVIVATFILLPNLSPNIAYAMEQIPVIGKVVHVITIRNYHYSDPYHDLDVEVPSLDIEDDESNADEIINKNVEDLTNKLMNQFYDDIEEFGVSRFSLNIDYDVITNTEDWFTLRIRISTCAASGDTTYEFYHIDKRNDKIIYLSDLFKENTPYQKTISTEVKHQMKEQMKADEGITYWLDSEYEEWDFTNIDKDQNFYFADNGNLVIVFDKYEVGPGSIGTPKFEINKSLYKQYLNKEFK